MAGPTLKLLVLVASAAVLGVECSKKDLVVGERTHDDKLVLLEHIGEQFSYFGKKVVLEKDFFAASNNVITQVRAIDQGTDDTGAEVIVTAGGPDHDYVRLKFKSQRIHGVYYRVELYARPK